MGAGSLLSKQGEIDLARRMERGRLRARRILSRSQVIQRMVVALDDDVRRSRAHMPSVFGFVGIDGKAQGIWGRGPCSRSRAKSILPGVWSAAGCALVVFFPVRK